MQLISPRKQQAWAKSYKDRAEKLEASGQMHEAGRAAIMFSKQSGLWNDTDEVDALIIPKDLQDALSANEVAWQFLGASAPSYRETFFGGFTLRNVKKHALVEFPKLLRCPLSLSKCQTFNT